MTEKQQLMDEAKTLGLSFANNARIDTIKKSIATAKAEKASDEAFEEAGGEPQDQLTPPSEAEIRAQLEAEFAQKLEAEKRKLAANMEVNMLKKSEDASNGMVSIGQAKLRARREAMALKRVIVTCKDPAKQNWDGEIITVSNDVVGDIKKFIPFNVEEGYHVPQIILNMLSERECTVFINKKGKDGKYVQTAKLIKAHNIEILPPLTEEEISELAAEQQARGSLKDD